MVESLVSVVMTNLCFVEHYSWDCSPEMRGGGEERERRRRRRRERERERERE